MVNWRRWEVGEDCLILVGGDEAQKGKPKNQHGNSLSEVTIESVRYRENASICYPAIKAHPVD